MESGQSLSQEEALAREIERWQKSYYDEVHTHFAKSDKQRGNAALESWEKRFSRFLAETLPSKDDDYHRYKSKNRRAGLATLTVLQNFQRMTGEAIASFLEQLIFDARNGNLGEYQEASKPSSTGAPESFQSEPLPKVFISHSSVDAELAELIVDLLRSALNLSAEHIRATSVEGHRLAGGADVISQLRKEILETSSFIGLISQASFDSAYVLFELGARWGTQRNLIPLLVPGTSAAVLKGPIAGYNALDCESNSQLQQLVVDLATQLAVEPEKPNVYQRKIERILIFAARSHSDAHVSSDPRAVRHATAEDSDSVDQIIGRHCEEEWPEDYKMRAYCEEQQRSALEELSRGRPDDIPKQAFDQIRSMCADQWPDDFVMRRFCEVEQFKAYRQLEA